MRRTSNVILTKITELFLQPEPQVEQTGLLNPFVRHLFFRILWLAIIILNSFCDPGQGPGPVIRRHERVQRAAAEQSAGLLAPARLASAIPVLARFTCFACFGLAYFCDIRCPFHVHGRQCHLGPCLAGLLDSAEQPPGVALQPRVCPFTVADSHKIPGDTVVMAAPDEKCGCHVVPRCIAKHPLHGIIGH